MEPHAFEHARMLAVHIATALHGSQTYGGRPYVVHLKAVEAVLARFGFAPEEGERSQTLLLSAILHDLLEDTAATRETIRGPMGAAVEGLVHAVTLEAGANRRERFARTYPKIAASEEATTLKLADRIANVEACVAGHNGGLLSMYRREHPEFRARLLNPAHGERTARMWSHLESLIAPPEGASA